MSQHDFNIANQGFPNFRADLNNALAALASLSSGDAEPTTTYANQLWYETDTNILHIRNEANSAWLDLMVIDQTTGSPSFTAGEVGIGTSSPAEELQIRADNASGLGAVLALSNVNSSSLTGNSVGIGLSAYTAVAIDNAGYRGATIIGETTASGNAHSLIFSTNTTSAVPTERMRITDIGRVGIGTNAPEAPLHVVGGDVIIEEANAGASAAPLLILRRTSTSPADDDNLSSIQFNGVNDTQAAVTYARIMAVATDVTAATEDGALTFWTIVGGAFAERARFDGSDFLVGKTAPDSGATSGFETDTAGATYLTRSAANPLNVNRLTSDGNLVLFRQDGTNEGNISVSGTTVSYNGGHLSRWAQFPDNSRPDLLKGTIMSNLDQMAVWDQEDNEQLNCVQVSAVEGDANVAGVFVAWDSEDDGYNDILLAMTGDMVIRIAGGTTVQRGDLLMSAGDGTAKPQGDDIVRAKTIAKVTSTHVSHTYADGSYAVPCVLMAC